MKRNHPVSDDQPDDNRETGSPRSGEPVFLAVGRLRRAHGMDGEILMDIMTDFPERLRARKTVYVGDDHRPMKISHVRRQHTAMLITFEGVDDSEAVGAFRNQLVFVIADTLPDLPEGEYYHHQLLGMAVVDENGEPVGFLSEILETGANDVYLVISPEGKETLLPAIEAVVLEVNLERREMRVRLPEWG
jgi:16S rRNA processing protein RimM